jgi:ornithine cyclodeaminase/alanine dehydrogenase-like protein (mu-crystallin family)
MQIIDERALREHLTEEDAFAAVRTAFLALGKGEVTQPSPLHLDFPDHDGEVHVKTAHLSGASIFAVKVASGFYRNADRGLPTGSGVILVFDATTGFPVALLDDRGYLTDLRTGAAGALAVDLLGPSSIERVAILGTGNQGRFQLRALSKIRAWEEVLAWSPDAEERARYCSDLTQELGRPVRPAASPEAAVRGADVVVTATPSREPLVRAEWLEEHATVVAVGADSPNKQELDVGVLARADKVVADDWSQCMRLGEIHHGIVAHAIELADIHAELGKILTGERSGREGREMIVCDLTGVGAQDAAIAELAWSKLGAGSPRSTRADEPTASI